jgi:hypothetical protein
MKQLVKGREIHDKNDWIGTCSKCDAIYEFSVLEISIIIKDDCGHSHCADCHGEFTMKVFPKDSTNGLDLLKRINN